MTRQVELTRTVTAPPPPGMIRPQFDGLPDYQRHAGSNWDFGAATQFALMFFLGLRQDHYLLDIGCGSLRVGRLLIPYLLPGHYYGIDPVMWPREVAVAEELGQDMIRVRRPVFSDAADFNLSGFGRQFDFLLAHSVFTHATQTQVFTCLAEAAKVMKPQAVFVATYAMGDEDNEGNEWAWPNCITYRPLTMNRFIEDAGLIAAHMDWPLFNPTGEHALLLIVRSEAEALLSKFLDAKRRGEVTTWRLHK